MRETKQHFANLPEQAPRSNSPFSMRFGRAMLRLMGWKIEGEFPNHPHMILAAAPHTSNWDFILAMLGKMALGIKISYLMKKEAFVWPLKGVFIRWGGIPIDRQNSKDLVEQIADFFHQEEKCWLAITPEGTRSKVKKWKTGFLRIAERTQAPVFIITWDFPTKSVYLDKIWQTTGDHEQDAENIREYLKGRFRGRNPELQ